MATVSNWIDHLNKPAEDVVGAIYPGVGSEGILVLILAVIWIGWTAVSYTHLTLPTKRIV